MASTTVTDQGESAATSKWKTERTNIVHIMPRHMKSLGKDTLVSLGTVGAAILATVTVVRAFEAQQQQISLLNMQLGAKTDEIQEIRHRLDTGDDRWMQVLGDLGKIKERLGIVESRPGNR